MSLLRKMARRQNAGHEAAHAVQQIGAWHEAAHAVVGLAVGADVKKVHLLPKPQMAIQMDQVDDYQLAVLTYAGPLSDWAIGVIPSTDDPQHRAWLLETRRKPTKDLRLVLGAAYRALGAPISEMGEDLDGWELCAVNQEWIDANGAALTSWTSAVELMARELLEQNRGSWRRIRDALIACPSGLQGCEIRDTACDDGNACTSSDVCQAGACSGGSPKVCVAIDQCHGAGTCDPGSGACSTPAKPNGSACDDANSCTTGDACQAGACQAGPATNVDDGNPCTTDACDPQAGVVHTPVAAGTVCETDGNVCNGVSTCDAAAVCLISGTAPPVDDGNPCTIDSCDPVLGVVHSPAPVGTSCSDGLICNGSETCSSTGQCQGTPLALNDGNPCTIDACDESAGVTHSPAAAGASCSDGNACNGDEVCSVAGSCLPGTDLPVDDENACTVDTCDAATGQITHTPGPAGGECRLSDCSTGACDGLGTCAATGPGVANDADPCTLDFCDADGGLVRQTCGPLNRSVSTNVPDGFGWIYSGTSPLQTGVAANAIARLRATLLSGKVSSADGSPLGGVRVSIDGHPELGETRTRIDGDFDLVVNGGAALVVKFEKSGYLSSERQVPTAWGEFVRVPEVALIHPDPMVTPIDLSAPIGDFQVAMGSVIADQDGERQGTLLFPPGTEAATVAADGTETPLSLLNVRITEYTVGPRGPSAMPAGLPATSAYTYAMELDSDEAVAIGARETRFSTPLIYYVDNFLGFPAGTPVPLGAYDREQKQWQAEETGVVLTVVGESAGQALVDVTGDGIADSGSALTAWGIDAGELGKLAELYEVNRSLWRIRIAHFSSWDANWPFGPPDDAKSPPKPKPKPKKDDKCKRPAGSVIECESATLREEVPIAGTPHVLHYGSDRAPGMRDDAKLSITLSESQVPASLKSIGLTVDIAGHRIQRSFPAAPDQQFTWDWDGRDRFGRLLQGGQPAHVQIDYVYDGVYQRSNRFGATGNGVNISGSVTRQEIVISTQFTQDVRVLDQRSFGIAGWSLGVNHWYDPQDRVLHFGDGDRQSAEAFAPRLDRILNPPANAAWPIFGADGTLYVANENNVYALAPGASSYVIVATLPDTGNLGGLARGPDGLFYYTDATRHRVLRLDRNGSATVVAGNGALTPVRENVPATQSAVPGPGSLEFGPDGSLYVVTFNRIQSIDPGGVIRTVLGNGSAPSPSSLPPANGTLATSVPIRPQELRVGNDGRIFALVDANNFNSSILAVGTDGRLTHLAGCGPACTTEPNDGVSPTSMRLASSMLGLGNDGSLLVNYHNNATFKLLSITPWGTTRQIMSGFHTTIPIRFAPDGTLLLGDFMFPGLGTVLSRPSMPALGVGQLAVPDTTGSELFVFDGSGRHLETRDAFGGGIRWSFAYDAEGRLTQIANEAGQITRIQRDTAGVPVAIVAPFGQSTALTTDANGYLASLTDPLGRRMGMEYDANGLLTRFSDGRPNDAIMTYDARGRLLTDVDPAGALIELVSTDAPLGPSVAMLTGEGRLTTFATDESVPGRVRRTITFPDGTTSTTTRSTSGSTTVLRDGTQIVSTSSLDPRFGPGAPIESTVTTLPSGLTRVQTRTRTVTLSDPSNPLSVTRWEEGVSLNGRTTRTVYQNGARTVFTPAGRQAMTGQDTFGRVTSGRLGSLPFTTFGYDAQGRLATTTSPGSRVSLSTFATTGQGAGYEATFRDPMLQTATFTHDALGRRLTTSLGNSASSFGWDPAGNLLRVTPPGKPAHFQTYTPVDLLETYTPPAAGPPAVVASYEYDLDRALRKINLPSGESIVRVYDDTGRLAQVATAQGDVFYSYYPPGCASAGCAAGRLADVAGPGGVDLAYGYDGPLETSVTWSGDVTSSLSRTFNEDFLLATETLNQGGVAYPVSFAYDSEGLQTCASSGGCAPPSADALKLSYHTELPLVTGVTLGTTQSNIEYSSLGELYGMTNFFGSTHLYTEETGSRARDALARITEKVEIVGGTTTRDRYSYDANGRLTEVIRNGTTVERYVYDGNGNRTSGTTPLGTSTGVYDAQDRLQSYGAWTFSYTLNGDLATKSNTQTNELWQYTYDSLGNLTRVLLPGGTSIEYLVDGTNRRVGKKVNGALVRQWIYRDELNPVAELDGAGNLIGRFVYGSRPNVPDLVIRYDGGTPRNYRVISDHLGSPVLAVNIANASDVPLRAQYTAFGVASGTGLDWLPFGFAGGRFDVDTGLVRFGARDYDPSIGRWVSKDPIRFEGDELNLYVYAGNDPVNAADPNGRWWQYLPCLYYQWKYGELLKECSCEAEESCKGDDFYTEQCQSGSGGFFGSKVLRCVDKKSPGALAKLISWCGTASSGAARSKTGAVPRSK